MAIKNLTNACISSSLDFWERIEIYVMKKILAIAFTMLTTTAYGQTFERLKAATSLGSIIGSAEACNLTIQTDAVAAWIEANVPADDLEFVGTLNMMTDGTRYNVGDMNELQLATHCIQVRRSAIANGLASAE